MQGTVHGGYRQGWHGS